MWYNYRTEYKKKYSKTQEQGCSMIQENQLETMNDKLCQVMLRSKFYDNPRKSAIACRSQWRRSPLRRRATKGLITCARLKMSNNVDRFLNKRRLENTTWWTILSINFNINLKYISWLCFHYCKIVIWFSLKHISWDRANWFGVDRVQASVRLTSLAQEIVLSGLA